MNKQITIIQALIMTLFTSQNQVRINRTQPPPNATDGDNLKGPIE